MRELDAAKARVQREAKQLHLDTRRSLIVELLPVLDNLDRTILAAEDRGEAPVVLEGVRMIRAQLDGVLRGYGVERVDAIDEPFDPVLHEAVSIVPVAVRALDGLVIEQLEPAYRFGDTLLRPAKVVVGRLR
ncbi:MAG: nucleotide exchange factor GrpE [Proteobacteria bacterium]|nr:nucleotide exchange factor GrpE [Pseudomonadota bacterium]